MPRITAARAYGKVIENYTLLRYPRRKVKFVNVGIGGDTAAGGLKRLQRDVFGNNATLLTVAFGKGLVVLGLLLLRKRLVRMEGALQQEGREYWQLRLLSDGGVHQVPNPQLTGEQVERLSAQLLGLLSGELDAVTLAEQPAGPSLERDTAKAEDDTDVSGSPNERQENLATS